MSVKSYADDLASAVHYALETTHAVAVCPFHLYVTVRIGDDAAESHAVARARKLVKSDGTTWEEELLRKEFGRQLSKAADRYCPHCALLGGPVTTQCDSDVNSFRPAFGDDYKKAVPGPQDETQFACEGCGDLVTLEKAKLRDDIRSLDKAWSGLLRRFKKQAKVAHTH